MSTRARTHTHVNTHTHTHTHAVASQNHTRVPKTGGRGSDPERNYRLGRRAAHGLGRGGEAAE
eukprot:4626235-Prymnesium_polylepis.1